MNQEILDALKTLIDEVGKEKESEWSGMYKRTPLSEAVSRGIAAIGRYCSAEPTDDDIAWAKGAIAARIEADERQRCADLVCYMCAGRSTYEAIARRTADRTWTHAPAFHAASSELCKASRIWEDIHERTASAAMELDR